MKLLILGALLCALTHARFLPKGSMKIDKQPVDNALGIICAMSDDPLNCRTYAGDIEQLMQQVMFGNRETSIDFYLLLQYGTDELASAMRRMRTAFKTHNSAIE